MKLYILPFDHRGSFKKIVGVDGELTKKDIKKIKNYKNIFILHLRKQRLTRTILQYL